MRNRISLLLLGFLLVAAVSCKPRERCPAYGHRATPAATEHRPS